jgi:tetratricopeptide (TPR) repeat protein
LDLARLLRDRGEVDQAVAVYRALAAGRPDDTDLLLELARTLLWAERYEEAVSLYRELVRLLPRALPIRLEFAQALYWRGATEEAFWAVAGYPSHDSGWSQAQLLLAEISPQVAPRVVSVAELIQQAIDRGDLVRAYELYARLSSRTPVRSDRWIDWVDFLQYQVGDFESARTALMTRAAVMSLGPDLRLRLAQLHAWTGHEDAAKAELMGLLRLSPTSADAWSLLGDLYRWEGDLLRASDAYRRALELSPDREEALLGLSEIRTLVDEVIAQRDRTGIQPQVSFFGDSDDFRRLDIGVSSAKRWYTTALVVRAGYRRLDGPESVATSGAEDGPFAELELVRWWRLGTIRAAISGGVQRLPAIGDEPAFNARVEAPNAGGTALQVSYAHGPAYPHTVTLASVLGGVRSDDIQVSAYRAIGEGWSLAGAATVVSLRGGGVDNWRLSGTATASRELSRSVSAGVTSSFLTHTDAAPLMDTRRLYWDPSAFWTNSVVMELKTPAGETWLVYCRLTPGVALARERTTAGPQLVPQFGSEAGAAYEKGRLSLGADAAYYRGRAGGYNSVVANLRMSVRP